MSFNNTKTQITKIHCNYCVENAHNICNPWICEPCYKTTISPPQLQNCQRCKRNPAIVQDTFCGLCYTIATGRVYKPKY